MDEHPRSKSGSICKEHGEKCGESPREPKYIYAMTHTNVLNPTQLLDNVHDHWAQQIIGSLNDYDIKIAKLLGEFVWHSHPDTDELFLILTGTLKIKLRDREVTLKPGELFVVPKGVEHLPVAEEEVGVLLLEPKGVVNTGDAETDRRVDPRPMDGL